MVCFGEFCLDCLLRPVFIFHVQAGASCLWTNDSQRFLLDNFNTIYNSPSQLYHSALLFSPSSSWLHECYSLELSQEAKVVKGLPAEWGMCFRTVLLDDFPWSLSCWNNTIAVGSTNRDIFILDAITGSQTAVLPGHKHVVRSLTFSSDGTLLVSGGDDKTVGLWDMQTGGMVKTFCGHTRSIYSVSISVDHSTIASGSDDNTLRLWDIQKGECCQIITQQQRVSCVQFSPTNPQCFIFVSGGTVQQWDVDGHKVGPTYNGYKVAFSPDGTQCIVHARDDVTVLNINSGAVVEKFGIANSYFGLNNYNSKLFSPCCFSPDNKLVAAATAHKICVWDITGPYSSLVETFVGHITNITSLAFSSPSTLISASQDQSVKFWQVGASPTGPIVTDPKSTPHIIATTKSIPQKAKSTPVIPSDLADEIVKTWGILTSSHKGSLQIPAKDSHQGNIQLIDGKLIFVWYADEKVNIWDAEKGELFQTVNVPRGSVVDLRVSGDGSKVFCLYEKSIQAWNIWTGEAVGRVELQGDGEKILAIDGSKVWIGNFGPGGNYQGQNFGVSGSTPIKLSGRYPDKLYLDDTKVWETNMSRVKDTVTGKVVFQLPESFGKAIHVQWAGQYLVVSFMSKEVLILDSSHMSP